jgi:CRP-like cAMP-binding protein
MIECLHFIGSDRAKTKNDIAAAFDVTKARVSKLLSGAREKGYLSKKGLTLTILGRSIVSEYFPD